MSVAAGQGLDNTPLPPSYARGPEPAPRSGRPDSNEQDEAKLIRRLLNYISMSDRFEEQRRKTDRVGGNIYYGRHWNVQVATNRAAITCNVARTLVDHKIAIMTKQKPIPVVEAIDVGDTQSAQFMRSTIMGWWERDEMGRKLERALYLANTTRSSALKAVWDTTLLNGIGDITFDVLPGWKLIVDGRTDDPDRMQFAGDRALIPRSRAMVLYPKAADKIEAAPAHREQGPSANASGGGSPIRDQWQRSTPTFPTTAIVNSVPMLLSYSGDVPHASVSAELVQIVELYIRDFRMEKIRRIRRDREGNIDMEPVIDKDGLPQFEQTQSESYTSPEGIPFSVPRFQLMLQPVIEEVYIRKYPFWRRCTLLIDAAPDARLIEDIAWDYPLPYAYCHDGDVLEGFWRRGCILDLESLQGALNVSISTMLDNLRFSAYRAYIAYNGSMIERNNMNIAPGEILRAGEKGTLEPLPVPEISQAWFNWVQMVIGLMERVIGATGIMQGQAQGRVDSAAGYDMLAEIGGSVLVKCTQRMERTIADATRIAGAFMQKHYYDGQRAVAIEDANGQEHYERIAPGSLFGSFTYKVLTGSSLAWSETAVRERVLEELQQGLRDKISAWKALHVEDWQAIFDRMTQDAQQQGMPAAAQAAPPPRTRRSLPSQKTQRMNQGPGAFG
jgi:hypothetical protein